MTTRRLIAFAHGLDDPACRFRIRQYAPCLEQAGWSLSLRTNRPERPWDSPLRPWAVRRLHQSARVMARRLRRQWDIDEASSYDAVLVNRDLLRGDIQYERRLLERNPRVIFDFDDAIFLGKKAAHVEWICRRAAWVTAGNELLADFARQFTNRVTMLPTVIETDAYRVRPNHAAPGPVRVGWLGSDRSIRDTLFPHLPMLARLQRALPFELVVISRPRPDISETGLRWRFVEWTADVETRIADLFEIGIMPLQDDPFQRAKCGCKLLQYMAAGLPAVASPVGINTHLTGHGERGHLASTEADWHTALETLIRDPTLREHIGRKGREFVEADYSRSRWFPVLLGILESVAGPSPLSA